MGTILVISVVWAVVAAGIFAMRKIEPNDNTYPVYVVIVGTLFTAVELIRVFLG